MIQFKVSKILLALSLCGVLAACSSQPKHSFARDTPIESIEQDIAAQMENMKEEQLDVLSPQHFERAEKVFSSARKDIADGDDRTAILNKFQVVKNELAAAKTHAQQWQAEFAPVLEARKEALNQGIPESEASRMASIDNELRDITEEKYRPGRHNVSIAKLQQSYMNVKLEAIRESELSQAKEMMNAAIGEGARAFAQRSLKKTETAILNAERQIAANRDYPEAYRDAVAEANLAARELVTITNVAKEARGQTPEQIALAVQAKEKELARQRAEANVAEQKVDVLEAQTTVQNQRLRRINAANQDLASEQARLAKLREIESKFSPDEAEVYRQGDNVVVRLKAVQFHSADSALPEQAIPTLAKVKAVIEDLSPEKVVVEGHTDSIGNTILNQKLSEKRAQSVSTYLKSSGEIQAPIETVGYGFEKPLATNKTKEGRAINRRVDIIIEPGKEIAIE